jgi:alcohol dehydrogenase (cytochrome c)
MAGGDRTTSGFLDGWDPNLWRRYTIPAPGEPGSETWPKDIPDAWKYGGQRSRNARCETFSF